VAVSHLKVVTCWAKLSSSTLDRVVDEANGGPGKLFLI
jgi:hypothetical protein